MKRDVICSLCGITLTEHSVPRHTDSPRCQAGQLAIAKLHKGLRPVELKWQAKSDHVAVALRLFGHDVQLLPTRARFMTPSGTSYERRRGGAGNEAWTSPEGVALALLIEHAAKLLAISYPEAGRRLYEKPEVIGPFGAARLLDSDDSILTELLQPIDWVVGSDGRRRARRLTEFLGRVKYA